MTPSRSVRPDDRPLSARADAAQSALVLSDPLTLLQAQLQGMDAWHQARRAEREEAAALSTVSREARLDAARREDARQREHEVICAHAGRLDDRHGDLVQTDLRVVVAHRHPWTRDALSKHLSAADGVEVVLVSDNGADAVGACVAEQPHLLVLDDILAMRSGAEVAADVARFCPHTVVTGYVNADDAMAALLEAGATAVITRRIPPAEAVQRLLAVL